MYPTKNLKSWRQASDHFVNLSSKTLYTSGHCKLINLQKIKKKFILETDHLYILDGYKKKLAKYIIERSKPAMNKVQDIDLYFLNDAYLTDITIVYNKQKQIFTPSAMDSNFFEFSEIKKYQKDKIKFLNESVLMIFKSGKNNYGHLLIEILPKLYLVLKNKIKLKNISVFVPTIPKNLRETFFSILKILEQINNEEIKVYENKFPIIQVKELLYCGPISNHSLSIKSPIIREFANFIKKKINFNIPTKSRMYIDRKDSSRMLSNREEIISIFKEFDFQIIDPSLLSFEDQVAYFANAKYIAGTLGAGMSNIIFAEEGTNILMIDPGLHDFFFFDLASISKLNFNWYFNDLFGYSIKKSTENYKIEADNIRLFLQSWLAQN
jgi:hypothetical protein